MGPVQLDEETRQPRYEIETILDSKYADGDMQYLIKWKGYDDSETSWEPLDHLDKNDIRAYHKLHGPPDPTPEGNYIADRILRHKTERWKGERRYPESPINPA